MFLSVVLQRRRLFTGQSIIICKRFHSCRSNAQTYSYQKLLRIYFIFFIIGAIVYRCDVLPVVGVLLLNMPQTGEIFSK